MTRPQSVPTSVLDIATLGSGQTSADALLGATRLAVAADRLGYLRYWTAEHHNVISVASTTPAVLIAHLANHTHRIRLGSGGVMLPNHAPLVVAEQFAVLEALNPGRIDLGVGRAAGTDSATAFALRQTTNSARPDFIADIKLVQALLEASAVEGDPVSATPTPTSSPAMWVLGSTISSAAVAATLGLPYAFAQHFGTGQLLDAFAYYRGNFQPSRQLAQPYAMVAVEAVAAGTDAEAERLFLPVPLTNVELSRGIRAPLRTPEEAATRSWTKDDLAYVDYRLNNGIVGSQSTARAKIESLVQFSAANEIMIMPRGHDVAHRIQTLELLAGHDGGTPENAPEQLGRVSQGVSASKERS